MRVPTIVFALCAGGLGMLPPLHAAPDPDPATTTDGDTENPPARVAQPAEGLAPTFETRSGARILTLSIPAPRGQIVDRAGRPLAQNRVAYLPALKFPAREGLPDHEVLRSVKSALATFNKLIFGTEPEALPNYWVKSDEDLLLHYQNRRWLPYLVAERELSEEERKKVELSGVSGIMTHPVYFRHYPEGELACHILGYVGKTRPLPVGPVENGDPLFHEWEGRSGIEASLNEFLTGQPGSMNVIFNAEGQEIERDILKRPVPGHTVVLTLDANMQKLAEEVLYFKSSMVVMDCHTGEILAMASHPGFNPNDFIPFISDEKFRSLAEDERKPLYGRAFMAAYPPASTFKVPMAIAAMKQGVITAESTIGCPAALKIGNLWFNNWHSSGEGSLTIRKAIARSCNTFFYRMGMDTGADALVEEARLFGFGQATGIPLEESPGLLPTNDWMMETQGHYMHYGDIANFSIGQGFTAATPLQVAQAMTGIANGIDIWRAQLVRQVQSPENEVVQAMAKESVGRLEASEKLLEPIRQGMVDVVHASYGTGKQGYNPYAPVAAKTGTAQWRGDKRMTWFAGYLPANEPQYSFSVAYEGGSSGGSTAAPIVKKYFTSLYGNRDPDEDLYAETAVPEKAEPEVAPEPAKKERTYRERNAEPKPIVKPTLAQPAPEPKKKKGFFGRLFGR